MNIIQGRDNRTLPRGVEHSLAERKALMSRRDVVDAGKTISASRRVRPGVARSNSATIVSFSHSARWASD